MRDLERYARNIRNENRATITTHKNAPRKNEGVDGDIRITTTLTEGVKLFSKYQGQWYSTPLSKHIIKEKNEDRRAVNAMSSLEEDGYQELDSGLIIQWGISIGDEALNCATGGSHVAGHREITFPKAFPKALFTVVVAAAGNPNASGELAEALLVGDDVSGDLSTYTNTEKFHFHTYRADTGAYADIEHISWMAIGH